MSRSPGMGLRNIETREPEALLTIVEEEEGEEESSEDFYPAPEASEKETVSHTEDQHDDELLGIEPSNVVDALSLSNSSSSDMQLLDEKIAFHSVWDPTGLPVESAKDDNEMYSEKPGTLSYKGTKSPPETHQRKTNERYDYYRKLQHTTRVGRRAQMMKAEWHLDSRSMSDICRLSM